MSIYSELYSSSAFAGKHVVITGAASGIGLEAVKAFLLLGATVDGIDRARPEIPQSLAKKIGRESEFSYMQADVSRQDDWDQVENTINERQHCIDALINAAGVLRIAEISETTQEDLEQLLMINIGGSLLALKALLPLLASASGSSVVNISSISALTKTSFSSIYAASKGAMISLTKAAATEFAHRKKGIRVNCVSPGVIDTPMTAPHWQRWASAYGFASAEDARNASLLRQLVPNFGQPKDVVLCLIYLAHSASNFINGENIIIDGGYSV